MTDATDGARLTAVPGAEASAAARSGAAACRGLDLVAELRERLADARMRALRVRVPGQSNGTGGAPSRLRAAPAPADGLPSRRAVLAVLAGAGSARRLVDGTDALGPAKGGDAGLVAIAARVEVLAARFSDAVELLAAVGRRLDELEVPRSETPSRADARAVRGAAKSVAEAAGMRRAVSRKYDRANRRLVSAVAALTGVEAASCDSAVAKARACVAAFDSCGNCDPPEWLSAFILSSLRDVIANGRAA